MRVTLPGPQYYIRFERPIEEIREVGDHLPTERQDSFGAKDFYGFNFCILAAAFNVKRLLSHVYPEGIITVRCATYTIFSGVNRDKQIVQGILYPCL